MLPLDFALFTTESLFCFLSSLPFLHKAPKSKDKDKDTYISSRKEAEAHVRKLYPCISHSAPGSPASSRSGSASSSSLAAATAAHAAAAAVPAAGALRAAPAAARKASAGHVAASTAAGGQHGQQTTTAWRLEVELLTARDLLAKAEDSATSHCFCSLAYQGAVSYSHIHSHSLDPTFRERFTFALPTGTIDGPLKITLWSAMRDPFTQPGSPPPLASPDDVSLGSLNSVPATPTAATPYSPKLAADARFLGQAVLKASLIETSINSGKNVTLPLQKRTPRSKVRGDVTLRLSKAAYPVDGDAAAEEDESQYRQLDPNSLPTDESFPWMAPANWSLPTLHFWRIAHDALLIEATHFEDVSVMQNRGKSCV